MQKENKLIPNDEKLKTPQKSRFNPIKLTFLFVTIVLVLFGMRIFIANIQATSKMIESWDSSAETKKGNDFIAIYAAAKIAAEHGINKTYDSRYVKDYSAKLLNQKTAPDLPAAYPPAFYLTLEKLTTLDLKNAYFTWIGITSGLLTLAVFLFWKNWKGLAIFLMFPLTHIGILFGQSSPLFAALLGFGILLLPNHPKLSGIPFGLLALKPQLALLVPICLFAARKFGTLTVMGLTASFLYLFALVYYGPLGTLTWLNYLPEHSKWWMSEPDSEHLRRMPTLYVNIFALTNDAKISYLIFSPFAIYTTYLLFNIWRRTILPYERSLSLLLAMPLATPYLWFYDLIALIFPTTLLIKKILTTPSRITDISIAGFFFLIPITLILTYSPPSRGIFFPGSQVVVAGSLLLLIHLNYKTRKDLKPAA